MSAALPVIRGMRDVREVLRQRAAQLGIAFSTYDVIAGLPDGYASKLLGPDPLKNFGETSFDALLGAAALMLVPVEDAEALARINSRLKPLERAPSKRASPVQRTIRINKSFFKKIGRIGGQKSGVSRRARAACRKAISEQNRRNAAQRWEFPKSRQCPICNGTGARNSLHEIVMCDECRGEGIKVQNA